MPPSKPQHVLTRKPERVTTTTVTTDSRRELAHRVGDGLQVFLFWCQPNDSVVVEVLDERRDEGFEFEVEARSALDAFHHPYAYAADHVIRVPTASAKPLAA